MGGGEIRMVPPNWQHPKNKRGHRQPMYDRNVEDELADWLRNFDRIRGGALNDIERKCYSGAGQIPLLEWLHDEGAPPDPAYYRPWRDEEATWVQVWETVSEGTPITPAFATRAELVDYLVANGDEWDQRRGNGGYSRAQAEAFVNAGWAPSMVVLHGEVSTGIAAAGAVNDAMTPPDEG